MAAAYLEEAFMQAQSLMPEPTDVLESSVDRLPPDVREWVIYEIERGMLFESTDEALGLDTFRGSVRDLSIREIGPR